MLGAVECESLCKYVKGEQCMMKVPMKSAALRSYSRRGDRPGVLGRGGEWTGWQPSCMSSEVECMCIECAAVSLIRKHVSVVAHYPTCIEA